MSGVLVSAGLDSYRQFRRVTHAQTDSRIPISVQSLPSATRAGVVKPRQPPLVPARNACANKNSRIFIPVQSLPSVTRLAQRRLGQHRSVGRRALALYGRAAAPVVLAECALFCEGSLVVVKRFFECCDEVILQERVRAIRETLDINSHAFTKGDAHSGMRACCASSNSSPLRLRCSQE